LETSGKSGTRRTFTERNPRRANPHPLMSMAKGLLLREALFKKHIWHPVGFYPAVQEGVKDRMSFLKAYLLTLLPFVLLDAFWLGLVAPKFYKSQIGFIMAKNPNWTAAVVFYLLYIAGVVVFVTGRGGTPAEAALRGALFGLVCYATYDLTNLATLEGWPVLVTVVDLCWGTFLTAATAFSAVWLGRVF
jgi:uncharacterized membrane protein